MRGLMQVGANLAEGGPPSSLKSGAVETPQPAQMATASALAAEKTAEPLSAPGTTPQTQPGLEIKK